MPSRSKARPVAFIRSVMNGFELIVQVDLVDRHRRLLAARAAECGRKCFRLRSTAGLATGMQAVGDLDADIAGPRLAFVARLRR